jgi:hypothetical protein
MEIDRRRALTLLGAGVASARLGAAQQHLHALAAKPAAYQLQFFSPAEHDLIDAVAELIIPADSRSPGAHEAKVAAYIDLVAAHSPPDVQANWKSRLAAFRELVGRLGTRGALEQAARKEREPSTPAEHFFVDLKRLTVSGYYTTEIGLLRELGYQGNQALASFPGCQHDPAVHK